MQSARHVNRRDKWSILFLQALIVHFKTAVHNLDTSIIIVPRGQRITSKLRVTI